MRLLALPAVVILAALLLAAQCTPPHVMLPGGDEMGGVPSTGGSTATGGNRPTGGAKPECEYVPSGRSKRPSESRIVGGRPSPDGAYPWMAALETGDGWQYCGGTVIAPRWVLTAAHCQVQPGEVAHVGTNDLTQPGRRVTIGEVRNHPLWRGTTTGNDVAVLRLDADALVDPIELAREMPAGGSGVTIGWGAQHSGGSTTPVQRYATVPIVPLAACLQSYPGSLDGTMLCAGETGVDSCQGDSGGPLAIQAGDGWAQLGIVSWGRGCAVAPGVYTSVPEELEWIEACAR